MSEVIKITTTTTTTTATTTHEEETSLEERLLSKKWAIKSQALDELLHLFSSQPSSAVDFSNFLNVIPRIIEDQYQPVQEKSLGVLLAFLDKSPPYLVHQISSELTQVLIKKCSGSSRDSIRSKAVESILLLIEVGSIDSVISELKKLSSDKIAKVALLSLFALREAIKQFGSPPIPSEDILAVILQSFEYNAQEIRSEALLLASELNRWIEIRQKISTTLRPAQLSAFDAAVAAQITIAQSPSQLKQERKSLRAITPTVIPPQMKRKISNATNLITSSPSSTPNKKHEQPETPETAAMTNETTAQQEGPLSQSWFVKLEEGNWQTRKEALEQLTDFLKTNPKLKANDFTKMNNSLMRSTCDTNTAVLMALLKCLEVLTIQQKKAFEQSAKKLLPLLIERLKEKKPISSAVHSTLDKLFENTLSFSDALESITLALLSKTSKMRSEALCWLQRCVSTTKLPILRDTQRQLCELLIKCKDDTLENRKSAFAILASLVDSLAGTFSQSALLNEKLDRQQLTILCQLIKFRGDSVDLLFHCTKSPRNQNLKQQQQQQQQQTSQSNHNKSPQTPNNPSPIPQRPSAIRKHTPLGFAIARRENSLQSPKQSQPPKQTQTNEENTTTTTAQVIITPASPPSNVMALLKDEMDLQVVGEMRQSLGEFNSKMQNAIAKIEGQVNRNRELTSLSQRQSSSQRKELRHQNLQLQNEIKALRHELENEKNARIGLERKNQELQSLDETTQQLSSLGLAELVARENLLEESLAKIRIAKQELMNHELESFRHQSKCMNCGVSPRQVLVLPCHHRILCGDCSEKVNVCPLCSSRIESRITVYDS